ncbi:MAG: hypothetical protein GC159_19640 [Phycisphaera sp.]|nr:hypothetical protein [Phycisphaera sp.]
MLTHYNPFHARALVVLLAAATLGGCAANTPAKRIEKEPDVFAALPADVQDKVRQGIIDIGFTRDAVRLAKGRPNRVYSRTDKTGANDEVWAYTREDTRTRTGVTVGVGGGSDGVGGGVTIGNRGYDDYEYLRVVFTADRVTAIERAR